MEKVSLLHLYETDEVFKALKDVLEFICHNILLFLYLYNSVDLLSLFLYEAVNFTFQPFNSWLTQANGE